MARAQPLQVSEEDWAHPPALGFPALALEQHLTVSPVQQVALRFQVMHYMAVHQLVQALASPVAALALVAAAAAAAAARMEVPEEALAHSPTVRFPALRLEKELAIRFQLVH